MFTIEVHPEYGHPSSIWPSAELVISRPYPSRPYVLPSQIGMDEALGTNYWRGLASFRNFSWKKTLTSAHDRSGDLESIPSNGTTRVIESFTRYGCNSRMYTSSRYLRAMFSRSMSVGRAWGCRRFVSPTKSKLVTSALPSSSVPRP